MATGMRPNEVAANSTVSYAHTTATVLRPSFTRTTWASQSLRSCPARESFSPDAAFHRGPSPANPMRFIDGAADLRCRGTQRERLRRRREQRWPTRATTISRPAPSSSGMSTGCRRRSPVIAANSLRAIPKGQMAGTPNRRCPDGGSRSRMSLPKEACNERPPRRDDRGLVSVRGQGRTDQRKDRGNYRGTNPQESRSRSPDTSTIMRRRRAWEKPTRTGWGSPSRSALGSRVLLAGRRVLPRPVPSERHAISTRGRRLGRRGPQQDDYGMPPRWRWPRSARTTSRPAHSAVWDVDPLAYTITCYRRNQPPVTNVNNPRAGISRKDEFRSTPVGRGASIGANATIVCGHRLGEYCFIGAGAVVTKDVPAFALDGGEPVAAHWLDEQGRRASRARSCLPAKRRTIC